MARVTVLVALLGGLGLLGIACAYLWAHEPSAVAIPAQRARDNGSGEKHADSPDPSVHRPQQERSGAPRRDVGPRTLAGRVQTRQGRAVSGARVCAVEPSAGCCTSPVCTRSDVAGAFQLELENPASPSLLASHPGYAPASAGPLDPTQHLPIVLTLEEGGVKVAGSVVDAAGGPIVGAHLSATDTEDRVIAIDVSDDSGAFELRVAPGPVRVLARADGYSEELRGAEAPLAGMEIRLVAASSIVGRVIAEGTLEGVDGVLVSAHGEDDILSSVRSARSDKDGVFRLDGLRSGRYLLQAIAPHWRSDEQRVSLTPSEARASVDVQVRGAAQLSGTIQLGGAPCTTGVVSARGPVTLAAPSLPDGRLTLDGMVAGHYDVSISCEGARASDVLDVGSRDVERVWDLDAGARVTGTVLSARGKPVASIQVDVAPTPASAERGGTTCITDELGRFSCAGLTPGDYAVQILGVPAQADAIPVRATLESSPDVELRLHDQATLRVRIEGPGSFDASTFSLMASSPNQPALAGQLRGDAFVFDPIGLGEYEVFADSDPAGSRKHVTLSRDGELAELTLELPKLHSLQGRVLDEDRHAVPDVWVSASRVQQFGSARPTEPALTDGDGRFTLNGLVPGQYSLDASGGEHKGHLDRVASDSTNAVVSAQSVSSASDLVQPGAPNTRN
jgi:protocatechuate 3,4-dioxygenase beta subunit